MAANPSIQLGTDGNWGIKEDNLLAYKKDGDRFFNKEFDFSRGSSATYVAKDGLIKTAGLTTTNLVQNGDFSQEGVELVTNGGFDTDSNWTKGSNTTIANGKATTTGTGAFGSVVYQSISLVSGKFYKISIDIEKQSGSQLIARWGSQNAIASLNSTGTFTNYFQANSTGSQLLNIFEQTGGDFVGSIDNVSVVEVGQNWVFNGESEVTSQGGRVYSSSGSISSLQQNSALIIGKTYKLTFNVIDTDGSNLSNGDGSIIYNTGTTGLKTFEFVANTTSLVLKRYSGATDVTITSISVQEIQLDTPRIDFTDSPNGALLLEPGATNKVNYSENFTSYFIISEVNIHQDYAISPDGSQNATKVTFKSDNKALYKVGINYSGTHTISFWVKAEGADIGKTFNLKIAGAVTSNTPVTLTDSYVRHQFTGSDITHFELSNRSGTNIGTGSLILYGFQAENNSFATSYIPTSGTTATRLAEACTNSGSEQDFNSEQGVLYAEIAALTNISTSTKRVITLKNTDSTKRVSIIYNTDSTLAFFFSESPTVYHQTSAYDITQNLKIAFKYKENDFAMWVNGVEIFTDTSNNTFTANSLNGLHFNEFGTNSPFYGKVRNLRVYKKALTDTELQELTTQ